MIRLDRKRSLLLALVLVISIVGVAVGFALRGGASQASASPAPEPLRDGTSQASPSPAPELQDGRQFGLIKSVELQTSPGTIVFDPADLLTGEEANRAAEAHGDEVPVANDSYKVNDDPTVHTLALSPDVEIRLINWDDRCDTVPDPDGFEYCTADPESFKTSFRGSDNYWGFWVTLEDGIVVKIEEQYHP
jgi:hypothetical protein